MDWAALVKTILSIKFTGGVAGRISMVVMAICMTAIVTVAIVGNPYLLGGTVFVVCLFAYALISKIIDFAARGGEAAVLDSPELARLLTVRERSKGRTEKEVHVTDVVEEKPATLPLGVDPDVPDNGVKVITSPPPSGQNNG